MYVQLLTAALMLETLGLAMVETVAVGGFAWWTFRPERELRIHMAGHVTAVLYRWGVYPVMGRLVQLAGEAAAAAAAFSSCRWCSHPSSPTPPLPPLPLPLPLPGPSAAADGVLCQALATKEGLLGNHNLHLQAQGGGC